MRYQVCKTIYRGRPGFKVTGPRCSIFVRHEATARAVQAVYKATTDRDSPQQHVRACLVSALLQAEPMVT